MSDQMMDAFWALPPVARTLSATALILSLAVHMGLLAGYHVIYHPFYILKFPPELWRIPTSFLLTGPNLGLIFDTYFLFRYLKELELSNRRFPRREDLVWYLLCVSVGILALNEFAWRYTPLLGGSYFTFLPALLISLCYTSHQDQRGMNATVWFFTVPAQLVPYCMIVMSFLSSGGAAGIPLQIGGLLIAHLYDFLTRLWPEFGGGRNLLPVPGFLSRLVNPGTAEHAGRGTSGAATGSSAGNVLPESWKSRGSGHRLG
ncbi:related to F-LANa protein [Cephalotrichum gorgonifer]|uniref:Derlin n=1 Tax=Cephalotrichum gorgonifer TaxID=2041049 RepID=A0AAE8SS12_9PEZI|nr:related to F-LANa protein [Cephalotrichum gorgonifer]